MQSCIESVQYNSDNTFVFDYNQDNKSPKVEYK
jgi:hypothetical protein